MSTNSKPLEFKAAKPGKGTTKFRPRERRQNDFLFYLADGQSIEQACNLVGVTRAAYEQWRVRHEGFKEAVEAARESHRRDIACGFHGADAYARSLLDAIQRDESLPAPLRYRASKTILTRKGKKDWLPDPIPADAEPLAPYDDEQPQALTNDFPIHPELTKSESATSTPASPHERSESASANGATESGRHGQTEPASAARGNEPSDLQASKTEAEVLPFHARPAENAHSEAGQSLPHNPDNPDKLDSAQFADNSLQNQQDPLAQPLEANTLPFSFVPFTSPSAGATIRDASETAEPRESANGTTESGRHGQGESTSDARGNNPFDLQAPTAAAETSPRTENSPNSKLSQASASNVFPEAAQASEPKASAATASPHPEPPAQQATLSQIWLSHTFLHKHENPKAFDKLLANHIHAYQPATAPEELLVFRITQKAWLLRRVETWERVIADSRVAKVREKHPNAAAPACIAMALLERRETNQTRFYERTAKLRKEHEDALDRLESKLITSQQHREAHCLRAQRRSAPTIHVSVQGSLPRLS